MTVEERLTVMQEELDAWKRYNRLLIFMVVALVAVTLFSIGFMGKPVQAGAGKEIRAQSFIVVDKEGRDRAILTAGGISRPGFNEKSDDPAWLYRDHPYLAILDPDGQPRAIMGTSGLDGRVALQLTVGKDKSTVRDGIYLGIMPVDDSPYMEIVKNGVVKIRFMLTYPDAEPLIWAYGQDWKWQIPTIIRGME